MKKPKTAPKPKPKTWTNGERALSDLVPYKQNPRAHTDEDIARLADAIKRFGFTAPILVDKKNRVLAGHSRCRAAFKIGMKTVPVRIIGDDWTEAEKRAYTIWDNQSTILGTWDLELLRGELIELKASDVDLGLLGFSADELLLHTNGPVDPTPETPSVSLADRFGVPPFSVLNAREGWWQARKAAWISIGIQSELGRGGPASTSARVGSEDEQTYRTIGGKKKANAIPGGSREPLARALAGEQSVFKAKRKASATPGGSPLPAADYKNKERGDGVGRAMRHKPNAIPGGARLPLDRVKAML